MPRIAAALGVSPVTDISEVKSRRTRSCDLSMLNALATVKTTQPVTVATVRATAFEKVEAEGGAAGVEAASIDAAVAPELAEKISESSGDSERPDLTAAQWR